MNRGSWSVGFAAFVGCIVGGLIANELAGYLGWGAWLLLPGAIIGGTVGWCAVDFRTFVAGVGRALDKSVDWKPDALYWKSVGVYSIAFASLITSVSGGMFLFILSVWSLGHPPDLDSALSTVITAYLLVVCFFSTLMTFVTLLMMGDEVKKAREDNKKMEAFLEENKKVQEIAWKYNPIGIVYLVLWGIWYAITHFPQWVAAAAAFVAVVWRTIPPFLYKLVVQVHSERRRIVFSGILLGVVIGFFTGGSTLLGAVVGAILSIVEHELVAVRLLKIKLK